jgi:hypothetical protein
MSWDTTVRNSAKWTADGKYYTFDNSVVVSSNTKANEYHGSSDNSGWDTIYDASQTAIPPIGNADAGDVPFFFIFRCISGSSVYLKITDSAGGVHYLTVNQGHALQLTSDKFGGTTATTIEQIDVQSTSATDAVYSYVIQHD